MNISLTNILKNVSKNISQANISKTNEHHIKALLNDRRQRKRQARPEKNQQKYFFKKANNNFKVRHQVPFGTSVRLQCTRVLTELTSLSFAQCTCAESHEILAWRDPTPEGRDKQINEQRMKGKARLMEGRELKGAF